MDKTIAAICPKCRTCGKLATPVNLPDAEDLFGASDDGQDTIRLECHCGTNGHNTYVRYFAARDVATLNAAYRLAATELDD